MNIDLDPSKINVVNLVSRWCLECRQHQDMLYNDPDIKNILNRDFNLIFVDIDEHPDMWERFNFGGLPSIAFIEGRDKIAYGFSGYVGPNVFIEILQGVLRGETEKIELNLLSEEEPRKTTISRDIIYRIIRRLEERFDWIHGGFIGEYKSPPINEMFFLLNSFLNTGIKGYGSMVSYTLEKMAKSELYSPENRGFYRLSRRPNWAAPEKVILTELNAGLATLYSAVYRILKSPLFNKITISLEKLLTRRLFDKNRRLFVRGIYWDSEIDRRKFWDVNAYTALNLIRLYKVTGSRKCVRLAIETLEKLSSDEVKHIIDNGEDASYLRDYAYYLRGLLEAYFVTGEEGWLDIWRNVVDEMNSRFKFCGAYEDLPLDNKSFLKTIVRRPFVENNIIAESFLLYNYISGDMEFRDKAFKILEYYSILHEEYGWRIGEYANACIIYYYPPPIIEVEGYRKMPPKMKRLMLHNTIVKWRRGENPGIHMMIDGKVFRIK